MHTYGYDLPDTPNIDKFAAEGTLFYRAYSAGSWTTPSFGAIHTGLFPTVHGMGLPPYLSCGNSITRPMVQGEDLKIPAFVNLSLHKPVLAEVLKSHGMVTAVDNANCWSLFDVIKRGWDSVGFFPGWELTLPGHPETEDPIYFTAPKTLSWAQNWLGSQYSAVQRRLWKSVFSGCVRGFMAMIDGPGGQNRDMTPAQVKPTISNV